MSHLSDLKFCSVRRGDLESRSSLSDSGLPNTTLADHCRDQLERLYDQYDHWNAVGFEGRVDSKQGSSVGQPGGSEEAYDFPLFAQNLKSKDAGRSKNELQSLSRVILRSPTPANSEPSFVNRRRPEKYYFTGHSSAEQAERFRQAAISGQEIFEGLSKKWPGSELPWRVVVIKPTLSNQRMDRGLNEPSATGRRKRSGKKRRVAVRKKVEAESAKILAGRQALAEKEAAEREKRTRRNREKKVKRKQKTKLNKVQEIEDTG